MVRPWVNADDYWAERAGDRDGDDDELSAGEAVTEIYVNANSMGGAVDPNARDIVKVSIAVIDSWPDCEDTFDAVRSAVEQGFGKALMTILDCNVTTLIAAFFLFAQGTGPVKGFAVTLTAGLLASLFTAVFVSRQLFEIVLSRKARPESLSI